MSSTNGVSPTRLADVAALSFRYTKEFLALLLSLELTAPSDGAPNWTRRQKIAELESFIKQVKGEEEPG